MKVGVRRHVKGHVNAEVVSGRHNVEVVKRRAKRRAREIDNAVQENVQQDKFVLDKHLAVSVKKGKVQIVNKYAGIIKKYFLISTHYACFLLERREYEH